MIFISLSDIIVIVLAVLVAIIFALAWLADRIVELWKKWRRK